MNLIFTVTIEITGNNEVKEGTSKIDQISELLLTRIRIISSKKVVVSGKKVERNGG